MRSDSLLTPVVQREYRAPQEQGAADDVHDVPPDTASAAAPGHAIDLDSFVPAMFTWISNKLSRGASQQYLQFFGVGIEAWRCMVLLGAERAASAQRVCKVIGMDKSSVSRCFKGMQARGLITWELESIESRIRVARLTARGWELHDQIREVALARERAFLSVLNAPEQAALIDILKRLHGNLPQVERASAAHLQLIVKARRHELGLGARYVR